MDLFDAVSKFFLRDIAIPSFERFCVQTMIQVLKLVEGTCFSTSMIQGSLSLIFPGITLII